MSTGMHASDLKRLKRWSKLSQLKRMYPDTIIHLDLLNLFSTGKPAGQPCFFAQRLQAIMLYTLTLFGALFVATLTLMLGSGLLGSTLSLRLSAEGFAAPVIGVIMSGFYIGLTLGTFVCPAIVRRVGHIRAFAAFAAVNTAATLLYPLFIAAPIWFLFRLLTGISMMGLYMVVESWLNNRTEPRMRGRVFSVYMTMTFLGLGLGQLFLNVRDIGSSDLFLIVGICTALCLVPVVLTRSIHPDLPETASMQLNQLLRQAPMGLLGALVTGLIASAFYSLAPVFAQQSGLPIAMVARFMGLTILCGLVLQWPVGLLSDRFDRLQVLAVLALLACVAAELIILTAGRALVLLLVASGLYGGLVFTLYPVAVAHTNDRVDNREIVAASSSLILCYGLGACIGPLGAAVFMALLGPTGLYVYIALVAGLFGITVVVHQRLEKPKAEKPVPYTPVPYTSRVITSIHPYSESQSKEDEEVSG
jgi:MFS family permease